MVIIFYQSVSYIIYPHSDYETSKDPVEIL